MKKLIGSASSFESLKASVIAKMYWSDFKVDSNGNVFNAKGKVDGLVYKVIKGRHRLERLLV